MEDYYNNYDMDGERKYVCDCSITDKNGKVIIAHKHTDHVFCGGCKFRTNIYGYKAEIKNGILGETKEVNDSIFCPCTGYSQKKQLKNPDYKGE